MKRHSESAMLKLYQSWKTSGLSKTSFAKPEKISPSTFYYWAGKFEGKVKAPPSPKGFQPIVMEDIASVPVMATIRYPSGVRVEWHGDAKTIHLLKSLP